MYQVDESPRYAGLGSWEHTASFSSWRSAHTWRPLPRREWSVRDDYQVLVGTNRHTIIPTGWVQEENNLKGVLTAARELDPSRPYVAREYGVRVTDHELRWNPGEKGRVCRFVGDDNRVRDTCANFRNDNDSDFWR